MAGLQAAQALGCSFYLDLGSAAPVPFLGTQPSCVTQALTFEKTILQNSIEQSYQTALLLLASLPVVTNDDEDDLCDISTLDHIWHHYLIMIPRPG